MKIGNYIRAIPNFPKKGVIFRDITPLLNNYVAMMETTKQLLNLLGDSKIDKVVAMESRGFFFAVLLAEHLKVGFVPVRKSKKLPYKTISEEYNLEYGKDILEMHSDAIKIGEKVLIHDDVLATGGTASATCKLVEKLGGKIVQVNFLMELVSLKGREKLAGYETKSLLQYEI